MSENNMPAAEAASYELAFHVLPTVAEGEVSAVFDKIKNNKSEVKNIQKQKNSEQFRNQRMLSMTLENPHRPFHALTVVLTMQ